MDIKTKEQRSYNMSRVKSKNTKPEVLAFSLLREFGYKFKKHYKIFGRPDIAFPKQKVVVFIDGEFWHGQNFSETKERLSPFWAKKIGDNLKRDRKNMRKLRMDGWHIIHLWGRQIIKHPKESVGRIIRFLERSKT